MWGIIRLSVHRKKLNLVNRFRGLLPVVVDIETTGLNPSANGLLEIAAVSVWMDGQGHLHPGEHWFCSVEPFVDATIDPEALIVTGIDPFSPLRYAIPEQQALHRIFMAVEKQLTLSQCQRAILVGHNAWFDLAFLQSAVKRSGFTKIPFHSFTTIDTASLSAVALGETVLAKALRRAKIPFDIKQAHSAEYDALKTAELFCYITNKWGLVL